MISVGLCQGFLDLLLLIKIDFQWSSVAKLLVGRLSLLFVGSTLIYGNYTARLSRGSNKVDDNSSLYFNYYSHGKLRDFELVELTMNKGGWSIGGPEVNSLRSNFYTSKKFWGSERIEPTKNNTEKNTLIMLTNLR